MSLEKLRLPLGIVAPALIAVLAVACGGTTAGNTADAAANGAAGAQGGAGGAQGGAAGTQAGAGDAQGGAAGAQGGAGGGNAVDASFEGGPDGPGVREGGTPNEGSADPDVHAPPHDAAADRGIEVSPLLALCLSTGGSVVEKLCCEGEQNFYDTCLPGACSCVNRSMTLSTCICPTDECFSQTRGCTAKTICTPGVPSSCNDDPAVGSLRGTCGSDGTCTCVSGAMLNAMTGRCR